MLSSASLVIDSGTIEALSPGLLRSARCLVQRPEEAEDLVQDTWFSALRSATTFEGRSSLRAWLKGIMRRRAADRYRRQRPTEALDQEAVGSLDAVTVLDRLDMAAASARLTRALDDLPTRERTAVALCDLEDLDRDAAAERMQVTRGHLRVLLHRGRQKLASSLQEQGIASVA